MGDRICITIRDGERTSPTLYCHWDGLKAVEAVYRALMDSRPDVNNILMNTAVKLSDGRSTEGERYIYNNGEADGAADWDNGTWTLDLTTMTWTVTDATSEMTMNLHEAVEYVRNRDSCRFTQRLGIATNWRMAELIDAAMCREVIG
ncbi:MAG: hypothetical protein Q4Q58_06200 [Thermoplasmata archaeon]|nr:hypothetical protein [Thermoplasmata archaeon]